MIPYRGNLVFLYHSSSGDPRLYTAFFVVVLFTAGIILAFGLACRVTLYLVRKSNDIGSVEGDLQDFGTEIKWYVERDHLERLPEVYPASSKLVLEHGTEAKEKIMARRQAFYGEDIGQENNLYNN